MMGQLESFSNLHTEGNPYEVKVASTLFNVDIDSEWSGLQVRVFSHLKVQ